MAILRNRAFVVAVLLILFAVGCGDGVEGNLSDDDSGRDVASEDEGDEGEDVGGFVGAGEIPDFFPSDIQLPEGISLGFGTQDPSTGNMSLSGTFESGDAEAIQAEMIANMNAAGYEQLVSSDDIAVFIKNGVGRVRIRTRIFLGELTLTVDIDDWTDEQLDELRDIQP